MVEEADYAPIFVEIFGVFPDGEGGFPGCERVGGMVIVFVLEVVSEVGAIDKFDGPVVIQIVKTVLTLGFLLLGGSGLLVRLLILHTLNNGNRVAGHDPLLGVRLLLLVEIITGHDGGLAGPVDELLVLGL